ncbi:MAG TPA: chemotaxis protein CheW, partial [Actinoplanes sp.]|nr:chemotaxis protein CheW [Actinoplanes sp.]
LGARDAPVTRFVAARTDRGPIALATSTVVGIRPTVAGTDARHTGLLGSTPAHLVAAIGTLDGEALIQLQSLHALPDEVWAATAPYGRAGGGS